MTEASLSLEQLEKIFQEKFSQSQKRRLQEFDPETLAWLALPPSWTEPLAEACNFPLGSTTSLEELLSQLETVGLCERIQGQGSQGLEEWYQVQALSSLMPYMPTKLFDRVLALITEMENEGIRVEAFKSIAKHIPEGRVQETLSIINKNIPGAKNRSTALLQVGTRLLSSEKFKKTRNRLLDALKDYSGQLHTNLDTDQVLESFRSERLEKDLDTPLEAMITFEEEEELQSLGYSALRAGVPDEHQVTFENKTIQQVEAIEDDGLRLRSLNIVASSISSQTAWKNVSWEKALKTIFALPGGTTQLSVLRKILPYLPEDALDAVYTETLQLADPKDCLRVLEIFVPYLPEQRFPDLLKVIEGYRDEFERTSLLTAISGELLRKNGGAVLELARELPDELQTSVLVTLKPAIGASLRLEQILEAVTNLESNPAKARALIAIVKWEKFEDPAQSEAFALLALTSVRELESEDSLAQGLGELAPHLSDKQIQTAIEIANDIFDDQPKSYALARLLHQGKENEQDQKGQSVFSAVQQAVSTQLGRDEEPLNPAIEAARKIENPARRAQALTDLLQFLENSSIKDTILNEALEAIQITVEPDRRVGALEVLAPYLGEGTNRQVETHMGNALSIVTAIRPVNTFRISESQSVATLKRLREEQGDIFLHRTIKIISSRIINARAEGQALLPPLVRWATIGNQISELKSKSGIQFDPSPAGEWLIARIGQLIKNGNTNRAQEWIRTGSELAIALGVLEEAVVLGNRQLELAYRRQMDERHLRHFLTRNEQVKAFEDLLRDEEHWALHYLGMGGVGKTMLMRHITSKLASKNNFIPTRVDFDHLSPEYPVRKPGQLLIQLAEELRLNEDSSQESIYRTLYENVIRLHEELEAADAPADPLEIIDDDLFTITVDSFCDYARSFPSPVVLILDTTEELAKLQLDPTRPMLNVLATFAILKKVHENLSSIRVVFAGRRPLAQSGHEWALDQEGLPEIKMELPEHVEYLRFHEIRGFDEDEAFRYFRKIRQMELSEEMMTAVLDQSKDTGSPAKLAHRDEDKRNRYNPFDLSIFGNWIFSDPSLKPEDLTDQRHGDPYIEIRILRRLRSDELGDLDDLFPAMVLLGRFDAAMLRPMLKLDDKSFERVFHNLSDQEWIDYHPAKDPFPIFLEVDRNLYPRLKRYFQLEGNQGQLEQAKIQMRDHLHSLAKSYLESKLWSFDHLSAAIKTAEKEQAAGLWNMVTHGGGKWDTIGNITSKLLGEGEAVSRQSHPLYATVLATYISAELHTNPSYNPTNDWQAVLDTSKNHPTEDGQRWLRQRAIAGLVAAGRSAYQPIKPRQIAAFLDVLGEVSEQDVTHLKPGSKERFAFTQLCASCCAALDILTSMVGDGEQETLRLDTVSAANFADLIGVLEAPTDLQAFALSLLARVYASWEDLPNSRRMYEKIEDLMPGLEGNSTQWFDWIPPASLPDYFRLERLVRLSSQSDVAIGADSSAYAWMEEAGTRLDSTDAERLISYLLDQRLANELIPATELEKWQKLDSYQLIRRPRTKAHRAVPPLFLTLARGWLALGEPGRAIELQSEFYDQAQKTGQDSQTMDAANLVKLEVMRRMRMHGKGTNMVRKIVEEGAEKHSFEELEHAWAIVALIGGPVYEKITFNINVDTPLAERQIWWRTRRTRGLDENEVQEILKKWLENEGGQSPIQNYVQSQTRILERREVHFVGVNSTASSTVAALATPPPPLEVPPGPVQTENDLRLQLRMLVLREDPSIDLEVPSAKRRWAEIALEEGELLALRLPARAQLLFDWAYQKFSEANDPVGAVRASIQCAINAIHTEEFDLAKSNIRNWMAKSVGQLRKKSLANELYDHPALMGLDAEVGDYVYLQLLTQSLLENLKSPNERQQKFKGDSWDGWQMRLIRLMSWDIENKGAGKLSEGSETLLQEIFNITPPELDFPLQELAPEDDDSTQSSDDIGIGTWIFIIIILLVIIAGFIWILVQGYNLFNTWLSQAVPSWDTGVSSFIKIGAYTFFLIDILYVFRKNGFIRTRLRERRLTGNVEISMGAIDAGKKPNASFITRKRLAFSRSQRQKDKIEEPIDPSGGGAYRNRAEKNIGPDIKKALTEMGASMGKRRLPIKLSAAATPDQAYPLEALYTLAVPQPVGSWRETFQFWREGSPYDPNAPENSGWSSPIVLTVSRNATTITNAEAAWRNVPGLVHEISPELTPIDNLSKIGIKALHLMGRPISSRDGIRLSIGEESGSSNQPQTSSGMERKGHLIDPDGIDHSLAPLILIQADLVKGLGKRLNSDRTLAERLRTFAAETFANGAQNVLVLPALPPELFAEVLRVLGRGLHPRFVLGRREHPGLERLLNIVSEMRETIANWKSDEKETLLELALDVTLFTREPVKGLITNPFRAWLESYRKDFQFSPASWLKGVFLNAFAIPFIFIVKLPAHLYRLLKHLGAGIIGVLKWLFVDIVKALTGTRMGGEEKEKGSRARPKPDLSLGGWAARGFTGTFTWIGRAFTKMLDLFVLPEILNFLMQLTKLNTRPLTDLEIAEAKKVFGDSLRYWRIRIDEWSFLAQVGKVSSQKRTRQKYANMALTLFSTIVFSRRLKTEPGNSNMEWLIHELTHTAQMEHVGSQFFFEALIAQNREGYNYGGPTNLVGKDLVDFNREQQGDIVRDIYRALNGKTPYTKYLADYERLAAQLRAGEL